MSYQLVIAEKPSVARSIAGVIGANKKQDGYMEGNGYLVSWCIGHLVSLADAGAYDPRYKKWAYDDLPILPQEWQYIIPDEKKKQFDILRSLMERPDVDGLVCATDAGREGELIFRFVYQMAGCQKPLKRLWISSMEDAAIREGFLLFLCHFSERRLPMASLRDMVSEYQDDLRNGIAWLAFWREGRSWQAEAFHLDLDDTLYPEDRTRLAEIQAADPRAIVVNGYYSGYLGEEMNVAELAAGVRHHYDNGLNNIAPFMEAHSDELPPDVLEEARKKWD